MKLRMAQKADLPALTALWQTCFGDSAEEIRNFWKIFDKISVFLAEETLPIAMTCALPVTLFDGEGEGHEAAYLYAVCTEPSHRNRGVCSSLLAYAEEELKKSGVEFCALVPSGEELFAFYERLGYRTAFRQRRYCVEAARSEAKIRKISAAEYENLRQFSLYCDFISYPTPLLELLPACYRIETKDEIFCAVAEVRGETLRIAELLPDNAEAAASLAAFLGFQTAEVRTVGSKTAVAGTLEYNSARIRTLGSDIPFGMAKPLSDRPCPENAYLGLAFD